MSLMKKLLGQKQKKPTKQEQTQKINTAINELRNHINLLTKKKVHFEKKIAEYNKAAQQCLKNKDRKGAMTKLKLKKQVEKRKETLENQMFNLEVQILALDEALMNKGMMDALKVSANAMQQQNPDQMIEEAEETQETIQEALELNEEFNTVLNAPLIDYDEDELEQELAELDDEVLDDGLLYGRGNMLRNEPVIPVHKPVVKVEQKNDEEEHEEEEHDDALNELNKLEMEMNMTENVNRCRSRPMIHVEAVHTSAPQLIIA